MSTSAPLKSGSHLPTLTDWRWHLWQLSGEDFSFKCKHQILLSGSFNNQYTGELLHQHTQCSQGENKPCMPRTILSFQNKWMPYVRGSKTPPCHSQQQSKKTFAITVFSMLEMLWDARAGKQDWNFIMPIRGSECYRDLWVTTKSPFCSQSTSKPYIQITVLDQDVSLERWIHSSAVVAPIPSSRGK